MLRQFARLSVLQLIDLVLDKVVKAVYFFCLAHNVASSDIGMLGAADGYVALFAFGQLGFPRSWLRSGEQTLDQFQRDFSAGVVFWVVESVALWMLAGVVALAMVAAGQPGVGSAMWLLLCALTLLALRDLYRLAFLVRGRQGTATILGAVISFGQLTALGVFLWRPSVPLYLGLAVAANGLSALIWAMACHIQLHLRVRVVGTRQLIWDSLRDFVFWDHINRAVFNLIMSMGPTILSYLVPLALVGTFTIALKLGAIGTLAPGMMAAVMALTFGRLKTHQQRARALGHFTLVMAGLAVAQLGLCAVVGPILLPKFLPQQPIDEVLPMALWILVAISLFMLAWPSWTLIRVIGNQRRLTLHVFLPGAVLAVGAMIIGAARGGDAGVAVGLCVALGIMACLILRYLWRHWDTWRADPDRVMLERRSRDLTAGVAKKMQTVWTRFQRHQYPGFVYTGMINRQVPVFLYHRVEWLSFSRVLEFLRRNGYETIIASELWRSSPVTNGRRIMLAFDDGEESVSQIAAPLLERYGYRATAFIVPAGISETPIQGSDGRTFLSWAQVSALQASGVIEIQSHSLTHVRMFVAPRIVGFLNPELPRRLTRNIIVRHAGAERRLDELPWGSPIYDLAPRLGDRPRYFDDERLRAACVRYVERHGGADCFRSRGWSSALRRLVMNHLRSQRPNGQYETVEEQQRAIEQEIAGSKTLIESRLGGHTVEAFGPPWNLCGRVAVQAVARAGYRAIFGGFPDEVAGVGTVDWPASLQFIPRWPGDFLWRLPGHGKQGLFRLGYSKVIRSLFQVQDDAAF